MSPSEQSDRSDAEELVRWDPDPRQLDMFTSPPAQSYDPDPEDVRTELAGILARARAAPQQPWSAKDVSRWRTVFPHMANWLPVEEARQLRAEFAAELARLEGGSGLVVER